jgi:hypothetical protein
VAISIIHIYCTVEFYDIEEEDILKEEQIDEYFRI